MSAWVEFGYTREESRLPWRPWRRFDAGRAVADAMEEQRWADRGRHGLPPFLAGAPIVVMQDGDTWRAVERVRLP